MDSKEYLNQLSTSIRPEKKSSMSKFFSSTIVRVMLVGVVALILIIIVGSILSGGNGGLKNKLLLLRFRVDTISSMADKYQPALKSSTLRSYTTSLTSVLALTSQNLNEYIGNKYKVDEKSDSFKKLGEDENLYKDALDSELFEAKISGIFDRVYTHKMAYEISSILNTESSIYNSNSDENLKNILGTSYDSLNNLYEKFNSFSETD